MNYKNRDVVVYINTNGGDETLYSLIYLELFVLDSNEEIEETIRRFYYPVEKFNKEGNQRFSLKRIKKNRKGCQYPGLYEDDKEIHNILLQARRIISYDESYTTAFLFNPILEKSTRFARDYKMNDELNYAFNNLTQNYFNDVLHNDISVDVTKNFQSNNGIHKLPSLPELSEFYDIEINQNTKGYRNVNGVYLVFRKQVEIEDRILTIKSFLTREVFEYVNETMNITHRIDKEDIKLYIDNEGELRFTLMGNIFTNPYRIRLLMNRANDVIKKIDSDTYENYFGNNVKRLVYSTIPFVECL